ncbi:MAG: hypothetical protein JXQ81_03260 [Desulfuromonadales bacterium]|nr:hypothetical protein [Desulfuromonadales bacterium]MBN2791506.1 hypothetical protein [Desulfuromonadales bacterium]
MKFRAVFTCLFGLSLGSLLFGVVIWGSLTDRGHDFTGRCESCHLSQPQAGEPGRFARSISFLCLECHNVPRDNSHPIGIVPSMPVPDGFRLDWSGKMTCVTCHDPHASAANQYLRTEARGRDFCSLCHRGLMPMQDPHLGTVSIAHSKSGVYHENAAMTQILDRVSLECLSCHDGVIASDASYKIVGEDALTYQRDGLSHPIGMDYRRATLKDRELRPVETLSPYIALYDGKVGCASCHNPYSSQHRMLTMNNSGSALCLECHIK